ncbi:hypothetical protein JCM24511_03033 [Saitozyma sp. JCM 24511]|nr:hypothetical protein JCM24511_03033 [Saitozyma sp. JCM 24511]
MPIRTAPASSSRQQVRDRGVSDPIEDDEHDAEVQPAARNKGKGRAVPPAGSANGVNIVNGVDATSSDVVEEAGWTVQTYEPRPVTRAGPTITSLRNTQDKLKEMQSKIEDGMERSKEMAKMIEDVEEDDEMINGIDAGYRRALEQRQILQIKIDVLSELSQRLQRGEQMVDVEKQFKTESDRLTDEYMARSQRAKFKDSEDYQDFRQAIWEVNHPEQGCPPVSHWLEKGPDDEDDSDFEMGGTTQNYRCPLTLLTLQDAHTNPECGHSYSGTAIIQLLEQGRMVNGRRQAMKCPEPGCNAKVTKDGLKRNEKLQKQADEYEKRKKRREDEREGEEEDVEVIGED